VRVEQYPGEDEEQFFWGSPEYPRPFVRRVSGVVATT
jgi:hypothetical protein